MPQALSKRERECVVGFVEDGHSRREAARVFKTAPSTTVRIVRRFRETGSLEARPHGSFRHGKLPPHRDFILKTVATQGDITMPELNYGDSAFNSFRHAARGLMKSKLFPSALRCMRRS